MSSPVLIEYLKEKKHSIPSAYTRNELTDYGMLPSLQKFQSKKLSVDPYANSTYKQHYITFGKYTHHYLL